MLAIRDSYLATLDSNHSNTTIELVSFECYNTFSLGAVFHQP